MVIYWIIIHVCSKRFYASNEWISIILFLEGPSPKLKETEPYLVESNMNE